MAIKRSAAAKLPAADLSELPRGDARLGEALAGLVDQQERSREERIWLRAMIDQVPDYLFVKDTSGRMMVANRAVAADLGFAHPDMLIGKTDLDIHPTEIAQKFYSDDQRVLNSGQAMLDIAEHVVRPDGTRRWLSTSKLPLRGADGTIIGLLGIARDVTERREAEERIQFVAYHDPLTRLPNRARFELELAELVQQAEAGRPAALVLLDLDRFKHINDTLGHVAGDDLLRQVANRLSQLVGPAGSVARIGGDEFTILFGGPAAKAAESICAAILLQMSRPFRLYDDAAFISASMGIAPWRAGVGRDEMLREADIALYDAKEHGGGRWQVFVPAMAARLEERRGIEQDLRRALSDGGELVLEYQPILATDCRTVLGAEALVRWQHPTRGRLAPELFIGIAEERGLIEPLGKWVFDEACAMLSEIDIPWLAVNVSPVELRSRLFVDRVLGALSARHIDPRRLQLEITEGVLLDQSEATGASLERLRRAGIRMALDDFGTGYSSLNYLRRYNVDKLKIDRSFVAQLGESADAEVIVRTIIDLAHSLGMKVTAEGVATKAQRTYLVGKGVHELQGFLFSEPLPLEQFRNFPGVPR